MESGAAHSHTDSGRRPNTNLDVDRSPAINLTDVTPETPTVTRCAMCNLLDQASDTDRTILNGWLTQTRNGHHRRSAIRSAIHRGGGPLISETAFGRHLRDHT